MTAHLRKGWTPEKQDRLRELWSEGVSIRDIAADPAVDRHRDDVREMAKAMDLPKRSRIRRGPQSTEFVDRMPRQIAPWPKGMMFDDHPRAR